MRWRDLKKCLEKGVVLHPKVLKALKKVAPHVPNLTTKLFILTPEKDTLGSVFRYDGITMYLHPTLYRSAQYEIEFTIAHEFAHIVLEHLKKPAGRRVEREADALARKWGFDTPIAYH